MDLYERAKDPETRAKVLAHDKEKSAIHEAGHATVAAVHRHRVEYACIWENPESNLVDTKSWIGQCGISHRGSADPVVMLAGMVAEELFFNHNEYDGLDDEDVACQVTEFWADECIEPSESDMRGVPDEWNERQKIIEWAVSVLRENESLLHAIKSALMERHYLDEADIADLAPDEFQFSKAD